MKKILALFTMLAFATSTFASFSVTEPVKKATEIFIPVGKSGMQISLMDLSQIKVKEFESISGKKMKFVDKVGFKIAQRELRNSINSDGTLNSKKLNKIANKMAEGNGGFNIGGFALGFLLSLIGVLIAYVISDDEKAARTKWAWIGFALSLAIGLLLALA
jgi:uncharacterized BrkB/YihY/UPF0761 family membrane protein